MLHRHGGVLPTRLKSNVSKHPYDVLSDSDDHTLSQLAADTDDNLFANIQYNPHHVLHKLKTDHTYNLRPRRHTLSLTVKTDCNNFMNRLLFKI